jgi:hypothetical protein
VNLRELFERRPPGDIEVGSVLLEVVKALRVLNYDDHRWSYRPCTTCRTVSNVLGEPFGCALLEVLEFRSMADICPPHSGPRDTQQIVANAIAYAVQLKAWKERPW